MGVGLLVIYVLCYSTDDTDHILCSACVCVSPEDTGSRLSRADEAAGSAHIFRDVRHSFRRAKKQIHVVVADTESDSEIAEELSAKK